MLLWSVRVYSTVFIDAVRLRVYDDRGALAMEPGAKEDYLKQWLGYTETWGDPALREVIAGLYQDMKAENILVFHGAQRGNFCLYERHAKSGDHMIAMYPNYQSAYEVANSVPDCAFSKWWVKDGGDKWVIDFDELEGLIQPNTKVLAINSPNNPTGYTFTNEEIRRLCKICKDHDIYLFSDEVYKGIGDGRRDARLDGRPLRRMRFSRRHVEGLRSGRSASRLAGF